MALARCLFGLALLHTACVDGAPVDWPRSFEVGFLASADQASAVPPYGPFSSDDAIPFAQSARSDLILITLSPRELGEIEPRLDPRGARFRLLPSSDALRDSADCSDHGYLHTEVDGLSSSVEHRVADLAIRGAAEIFQLDAAGNRFVPISVVEKADWAISYDVGPCLGGARLEAASFVAADYDLPDIGRVQHLDRDSVLLGSEDKIIRVDRGASDPRYVWSITSVLPIAPEGTEWRVQRLDLDMRGGARRAAVLATRMAPDPVEVGEEVAVEVRLLEIEVGTSSISYRGTRYQYIVSETQKALDHVAVDPVGNFVAVGDGGWVTGALGSEQVEEYADPRIFPRDIEWTQDPETPVAIASNDDVWLGDPRGGPRAMTLEDPFDLPWRHVSTLRAEQGLSVYVASNRARIFVRQLGQWSDLPIRLDGTASECSANDICGRGAPLEANGRLDVAGLEATVFREQEVAIFGLLDCTGMFAISQREQCTIEAPVLDSGIGLRPDTLAIHDSSRWEDRVVMVGGARLGEPGSKRDPILVELQLVGP